MSFKFKQFILGVSTVFLCESIAWAADPSEMLVARVTGKVTLVTSKGVQGDLAEGHLVRANQEVRTPPGASVELRMHNGGVMKIGERSQVQITQLDKADGGWKTNIKILFGQIRVAINKLTAGKDRFTVEAPTSIAGIQGTDVIWTVQATGLRRTTLFVLKGQVEMEDIKKNKIVVKENQTVSGCTTGLLEVSTLSPYVINTVTNMLPLDTNPE